MTSLAEQIVEALNPAQGRFRAVHARGFSCEGTFVATAAAREVTTAAHLQGEAVPVTVRFSLGGPDPAEAENVPGTRAMSVKFHAPAAETDLLAINGTAFPARTPEDFLAFIQARADAARVQAFLGAHPEALRVVQAGAAAPVAASYGGIVYHAIHTYHFTNAAGASRAARYRWTPEAGALALTADEAAGRPRHFLQDELAARLVSGPVGFRLQLVFPTAEDDINDPATPWPEGRESLEVGRLAVTALLADQAAGEALIYDPTRVIPGIGLSHDPILHARREVYGVSYARRTGAQSS